MHISLFSYLYLSLCSHLLVGILITNLTLAGTIRVPMCLNGSCSCSNTSSYSPLTGSSTFSASRTPATPGAFNFSVSLWAQAPGHVYLSFRKTGLQQRMGVKRGWVISYRYNSGWDGNFHGGSVPQPYCRINVDALSDSDNDLITLKLVI